MSERKKAKILKSGECGAGFTGLLGFRGGFVEGV